MKIIVNKVARTSLAEFADAHGFELVIHERSGAGFPVDSPQRWYAEFKGVSRRSGGIIDSVFGNGRTPFEAVCDYADKISERVLVKGIGTAVETIGTAPRLSVTLEDWNAWYAVPQGQPDPRD